MVDDAGRAYFTATFLNNGIVLMAGGYNGSSVLFSSELYNPATGTFAPTGSLNTARHAHAATVLNDGTVLITGVTVDTVYTATAGAELYNPATGIFTATGSMSTVRSYHTAKLLYNGMALVLGRKQGPSGSAASADLYLP